MFFEVCLHSHRLCLFALISQHTTTYVCSDSTRFHSFNSWAAAKRLANYWTFRKEALGNRAFLPMDLSGKGAIPLEDVRMLQTGVIVHLPKDLEGRSVVYVDRSKLLENETMSPCMLFFTLQKIMENEVTYKKGYISLINLSNPFGSMFERENVTRFKDYIRKAMPIKVGTIHIVCSPPGEGMSSFVSSCKSFPRRKNDH